MRNKSSPQKNLLEIRKFSVDSPYAAKQEDGGAYS